MNAARVPRGRIGQAIRRSGLLVAALLLGACSILPKPEPVDSYLLPGAPVGAATGAATVPVSLRVERPASGAHLSGQRIVVMPQEHRVSVYKGVSWTEPAPVLVRDRLIDAFRADGRIAALSSDDARLQADFEIVSDLRAFQSEYTDGSPEVVVRLDARLVRRDGRRILASRRFEARERPRGVEVPEVVNAFGAASTRMAGELVAWTVDQVRNAQRPD